jgi:hypothetical protein
MDNWITIISFTYPHEAHLAKAKLESEGIEVQIKDEYTVQMNNFYSNALGGVKIQVQKKNLNDANKILIDSGYYKEQNVINNKFITQIDYYTAKLPLIGKYSIELRLLVLTTILLIIIITPIALFSMP